jgi:hypothetical protein
VQVHHRALALTGAAIWAARWFFCQERAKGVEAASPVVIGADPPHDWSKTFRSKPISMLPSKLRHADEISITQHPEVFRDGRLREVKLADDRRHRKRLRFE